MWKQRTRPIAGVLVIAATTAAFLMALRKGSRDPLDSGSPTSVNDITSTP